MIFGDAQIITTEDGETKIYIWNGTEWEELEIKGVKKTIEDFSPIVNRNSMCNL